MSAADITATLKRHKLPNLHLAEDGIPPRKLEAAQMSCALPAKEKPLALLDCTVWNSGRNGVLFTTHGMFMHNPWYSRCPGNAFLPYTHIDLDKIILKKYEMHVALNVWLDLSTAPFSSPDLYKLLHNLISSVFKGASSRSADISARDDDDEEDFVALEVEGERSAVFAALPQGVADGENVHSNIRCDVCEVHPIVGTRYQAANVDNFDCCAKCFPTVKDKYKFIVHTVAKKSMYATEEELRQLFDLVDSDKTGEINRQDFLKVASTHKSLNKDKADSLFTAIAGGDKLSWSAFQEASRSDKMGLHKLLNDIWLEKQRSS